MQQRVTICTKRCAYLGDNSTTKNEWSNRHELAVKANRWSPTKINLHMREFSNSFQSYSDEQLTEVELMRCKNLPDLYDMIWLTCYNLHTLEQTTQEPAMRFCNAFISPALSNHLAMQLCELYILGDSVNVTIFTYLVHEKVLNLPYSNLSVASCC